MTIAGAPIPESADLVRMRRDRHDRLQTQLTAQGIDALVLLGTNAVAYATGAVVAGVDASRASLLRPVAVVARGDRSAHLFTPYPEGAPDELDSSHLHAALHPDLDDGADALAAALNDLIATDARVAVDDVPWPLRTALGRREVLPAAVVTGPAKLLKTPDELACIRAAQRINEQAMVEVQATLRPGIRQSDLSATFLRGVCELGAHANAIDPIWQVIEPTLTGNPWASRGGIAFPTPTTDRFLREGDVVWVDTGLVYEGYASDFGRTWLVGDDPRPSKRQRAQYERWQAVMDAVLARCKPGVPSSELTRAAIEADGGVNGKPWIEHFYLAHGVGTESAEMPLVGTDLGDAFDESQVLAPGMVLVLEPAIWDEGAAGYRSEDIYAVTDDGWIQLSDYPYVPFGDGT
ncbi:MAG TPA: Xaa-Pro peptidase family protein [Acidimicrobiales bacterium]|nr:Xaa-Pro peptidase family protein [Acidimicrobiales bacterium]